MARKGYYKVWVDEPGWEIRKSQADRECWGVEVDLGNNDWLNTHASLCVDTIKTGDLYVFVPDRRCSTLNHVFWSTCLFCVAQYLPDKLKTNEVTGLAEWLPISQEDVEAAERKLQRTLKELHNMGIPIGAWA